MACFPCWGLLILPARSVEWPGILQVIFAHRQADIQHELPLGGSSSTSKRDEGTYLREDHGGDVLSCTCSSIAVQRS
ncbi:hypothetical protein BV20DRAFT_642682 [Pilatotrama ljubarskyi]|nr:hypothetical protein BV20DRAFT_642682 [Pilatotrama ljubarskyi]